MGSSEIDYRGRSFDARDGVLEVLFRLLVDEMDRLPEKPEWLTEVRNDWYEQATEEFGFGVEPELDINLSDESRRELILALARRVLVHLETLGDPIPAATLNAIGAGKPETKFEGDVSAVLFLDGARSLIELLVDPEDPSPRTTRP
jgi:hypothetical protein